MKRTGIKHTRRMSGFVAGAVYRFNPPYQDGVRKGRRRNGRIRRARNWFHRTVFFLMVRSR